jgi:site-specific DNA recombinase
MQKNRVFGYVRVSTQKQGREGVSLEAQREAIVRYAQQHQLEIVEWFEEQESAAKQGRAVFNHMVTSLKRGRASGFICHKLDRSVRNIHDWAALSALTDSGVQIHFAHEALDLDSLSGKLSADIQAAIAAHYSRNLSQEVKKGLTGRLKQGLLPFAAPMGYRNNGGGKLKTIDPVVGPLVRKAFEMYSTGKYSFEMLRHEMGTWGLRTKHGKPLSKNTLTFIFNSRFYYGVIEMKRTGESYPGQHEPLITKALYDRCQDVLHKRIQHKALTHAHAFRKRVRCHDCGYHLTGETQKGHVYYRCHQCKGVSVREESITTLLRQELVTFTSLVESHTNELRISAEKEVQQKRRDSVARARAAKLHIDAIKARQSRLVDALVEGAIDDDTYRAKRHELTEKLTQLNQQLVQIKDGNESVPSATQKFFELENALQMLSDSAKPQDLIDLVVPVTSNLGVKQKTPYVSWVSPFKEIAELAKISSGVPHRDQHRILEALCKLLEISLPGNVSKSPSPGTTLD